MLGTAEMCDGGFDSKHTHIPTHADYICAQARYNSKEQFV